MKPSYASCMFLPPEIFAGVEGGQSYHRTMEYETLITDIILGKLEKIHVTRPSSVFQIL